MKKLVAFVGFKNSGKNTAAVPLISVGYRSFSFADAIKDSLAAIFCWDRQMIEGITPESRSWREEIDVWWAERLGIPEFSPRWAMMHFGTQVMRQHFHDDIWLCNVERRIVDLDGPVVLTDCRFPNEMSMARRYNGMIIRIKRGDDPNWMPIAAAANNGSVDDAQRLEALGVHESEYRWINEKVDHTIENDGSPDQLYYKISNLVI